MKAIADHPVPAGVKPAFWRYLQACTRLIDAGKPCTQANLARELHISQPSVWKYLRRNPTVEAFVAGEMRDQNAHFLPPIVRRHSMLAMQGSVPSADFVAKVAGGFYTRALAPNPLDPEALDGRMVVNLLIPRPEYPQGALPALAVSATPLVPRPDIPTLNLGQP